MQNYSYEGATKIILHMGGCYNMRNFIKRCSIRKAENHWYRTTWWGIRGRRSLKQLTTTTDHITLKIRRENKDVSWYSVLFLCFNSTGSSTQRSMPLSSKVVLSLSSTVIKIIFHTCSQRPISQIILVSQWWQLIVTVTADTQTPHLLATPFFLGPVFSGAS